MTLAASVAETAVVPNCARSTVRAGAEAVSVTLTISELLMIRYSPVAIPVADATVILAAPAAMSPLSAVLVAPVCCSRRFEEPATT